MEAWEERAKKYQQAVSFLPDRLRRMALSLSPQEQSRAEEIRLRSRRPVMILLPGEERIFQESGPEASELLQALETATRASYHAALSSLREGFFTLPGGHRLGLSGTAVVKDGAVSFLKEPSSLSLRLAHEHRGAAQPIYRELFQSGALRSTLILSPPGVGKTTLLRDLVRLLSDRGKFRISLIDERSEVAALYRGVPQLEVGLRTDILEGCPKSQAIPMVLRSLSPQIIALDEITQEEDLEAMRLAAHCGAYLLATAHAASEEDLYRRPLYRRLLKEELFTALVVLECRDGVRHCRWKELKPC